jgi:hypothetical protein
MHPICSSILGSAVAVRPYGVAYTSALHDLSFIAAALRSAAVFYTGWHLPGVREVKYRTGAEPFGTVEPQDQAEKAA